jgi:DNA (cytosine-5)-methyltransferase 1
MNHLDLFSGIGGFSLAASWVWGEEHNIVSFVEIDKFCQKVLKKHWPDVPIHDDIRTYNYKGNQIDMLTAGFPCQDISLLGPGFGLNGKRSGIWRYVPSTICQTRPKYIIVENVSAINNRGLSEILKNLAACGYNAQWNTLPTGLSFGHRRNRTFIVAYLVCPGLQKRSNTNTHKINETDFFERQRFASILKSINPWEKWSNRPLLGRGISRIQNRVDRLKSLGNAIVPQVVVPIVQAIRAIDD